MKQEKNRKEWMPPFRSMNFSIYDDMLDRYRDADDIQRSFENCGLNGLEVIRAGVPGGEKIRPELINGVHLYFHIFWMDWWKKDYSRLDQLFDSREQMIEYYGGLEHEAYLNYLREDLRYAEEMGAHYVVFHVSEIMLEESYELKNRYSDEEVIRTSLEIINTLLDEREYPFDFLVENLWWGGLTLKDPKLTRMLIEGIHTDRKGIMLDTGHFMNTDFTLRTPQEGVRYLHEMLTAHEQEGLLPWFRGMHLQMSLGGEYVEQCRKQQKNATKNITDPEQHIPFYEQYADAYANACKMDQHRPFLCEEIRGFVERVAPEYITFEFVQNSREQYEKGASAQAEILGYR